MSTSKITTLEAALPKVREAFTKHACGVIVVERDSGAEQRNALNLGESVHEEAVKRTLDWLTEHGELKRKEVMCEGQSGRRRAVQYIVNLPKFGGA